MTCPRCGAPVMPQARQCSRCGLQFDPQGPMGPPARPRANDPRSDPWGDAPPMPGPGASGQWPSSGSMSGQWPGGGGDPRSGPMGPGMMPMDPRMLGMMGSPSNTPSQPNRYPTNPKTRGATGGLSPGAVLQNGRYRVISAYAPTRRPDGRPLGGFNQWVAIDSSRRGDRVALLELPLGNLPPPQADRIREALTIRLASMEHHPDLQTVLGSFAERGRHFLVLDFFEGEFLMDRVQRIGNGLSERMVLNYATQLLDVLEFLDKQVPPIVHGAINPESVVIAPDGGRVYLLVNSPFLIARAMNLPLNVTGPLTPGYSSPEQQRGQPDARSDLYSLGATLYYAATGYDSAARQAGIFAPARQLNPTISPPTEALLARSVRLISSQRYQHADEMALDVTRAMRGETPSRDPLNNLKPIFGRSRGGMNPITIISVISVMVVVALVGLLVLHGQGRAPVVGAVPTATLNPTAVALAKLNEGLSTGSFIFDRGALENSDTTNATPTTTTATPQDKAAADAIVAELAGAQAVRNGDLNTAITDFQQAVGDDPANAEARIYLADSQIDAAHTSNFITLEVAVSFANQDLESSRQALRGVALGQYDLNQSGNLPNGAKIRIEIASVGATTDGAPILAQYFTDQLARGNPSHTLGIIPWASYFANQQSLQPLLVALQQLAKVHVPVVAPIATTDQLPTSPYLFSLNASDNYQAKVIISLARGNPYYVGGQHIVVGIDPSNLANREVGGTVEAGWQQLYGQGSVVPETITMTDSNPFAQLVHDVKFYGANLVVFAGNGTGAAQLALALAQAGAPVPIITSSNADSSVVLGQDESPLGKLIKNDPNAASAMRLISNVSLADPGEWDWISQHNNQIKVQTPGFFSDFGNTFALTTTLTPDANAIYSYDALDLMVKSLVSSGTWTANHTPTPDDLDAALAGVNAQHPFQGISGRIAFTNKGVPDIRSLVFKSVIKSPTAVDAEGHALLVWQVNAIIPDTNTFCATSACTPS